MARATIGSKTATSALFVVMKFFWGLKKTKLAREAALDSSDNGGFGKAHLIATPSFGSFGAQPCDPD